MTLGKSTLLTLALVAGAAIAPASACDITDLPCWDGGKCNIKFKNHTAKSSGEGDPSVSQSSSAQTIRVTAKTSDGKKTGNAFSITAGASKTMNLEKKKDFSFVRITSENSGVHAISMQCGAIRNTLLGNGNCNIYYGFEPSVRSTLAYSCDNGAVTGPY
ncbi:MAG: hypothetical protein ACE37M_01740 [Henriciella sp.]